MFACLDSSFSAALGSLTAGHLFLRAPPKVDLAGTEMHWSMAHLRRREERNHRQHVIRARARRRSAGACDLDVALL